MGARWPAQSGRCASSCAGDQQRRHGARARRFPLLPQPDLRDLHGSPRPHRIQPPHNRVHAGRGQPPHRGHGHDHLLALPPKPRLGAGSARRASAPTSRLWPRPRSSSRPNPKLVPLETLGAREPVRWGARRGAAVALAVDITLSPTVASWCSITRAPRASSIPPGSVPREGPERLAVAVLGSGRFSLLAALGLGVEFQP